MQNPVLAPLARKGTKLRFEKGPYPKTKPGDEAGFARLSG